MLKSKKIVTIFLFLLISSNSFASQVEEPLAEAVRGALTAAINNSAPPIPLFFSSQEEQYYQYWLKVTSAKLEKKIPSQLARQEFLQTVWYESVRSGIEPSLVLAVIQVESAFRKHAISVAGARGYMQVMPFWMDLIGNGVESNLFHMQTNIRFGTVILRHYLNIEKGNLFFALGRYNGSRGKDQYPDLVFKAQKNWLIPDRASSTNSLTH